MRTITTNLYRYSELTDSAKQNAIKRLRERCVERASECDWMDANDTLKRVQEIAHVRVSIQQSSQGYYADWYTNTNEQYDLTDKEEFAKFKQDFADEFVSDMWCDNIMQSIIGEAEWDNVRSGYVSNVAWLLVKFCEEIEDVTLSYYEDDCVEEWIEGQDFEFTEDGRLYNQ